MLDDVKIIAYAGKYAVLMRQGNLYWFTDMTGIETMDMPANRAPIYPRLQEFEQKFISNMLREAGIPNQISPVHVLIVNDAAVCYDSEGGRVEFYNADALKLSESMFPRAYELFTDGIVLLIGGERHQEHNPVLIRCNSGKVKRITLDDKPCSFKIKAPCWIEIDYKGKGAAVCDLRIYY